MTRRLLYLAILAHIVVRVLFFREPRFFACEDDGYRVYQAFLLATGQGPIAGKFWLPGQLLAMAPLLRLGIEPALVGTLVATLSLIVLAVALRGFVRDIVPRDLADSAGDAAAALALLSPLSATLSQSA